jgi:hypothetical protein
MLMGHHTGPKLEERTPIIMDIPVQRPVQAMPAVKLAKDPMTFQEFLLGSRSTTDFPLAYVARLIGGPLAVLGGYTALNRWLQMRREKALKEELDDTRQEVQRTLLEDRPVRKVAELANDYLAIIDNRPSDDPHVKQAASALDQLVDAAESFLGGVSDVAIRPWGALPEALVTRAAVPIALAGTVLGGGLGYLGYQYGRRADPEQAKAKALKDQLEARLLMQPPRLFARLVPAVERRPSSTGRPAPEPKTAQAPTEAPGPITDADLKKRAQVFVEGLLSRRSIA